MTNGFVVTGLSNYATLQNKPRDKVITQVLSKGNLEGWWCDPQSLHVFKCHLAKHKTQSV